MLLPLDMEHLSKMFCMRCLILPVHIIKVHHHKFPMKGIRTSFMTCIQVLRALDKPKSMTSDSYNAYLVLKAIFRSSPSFILIWWYTLLWSILEKTVDLCNSSSISSNRGIENLCLMVMLFMVLKSTYIRQVPSFSNTKRAGTEHRLKLSLMYPQSSNSWIYH